MKKRITIVLDAEFDEDTNSYTLDFERENILESLAKNLIKPGSRAYVELDADVVSGRLVSIAVSTRVGE